MDRGSGRRRPVRGIYHPPRPAPPKPGTGGAAVWPISVLKVALVAGGAAVVLVLICNTNRGVLGPAPGRALCGARSSPAFLVVYTFMLGRTRFGRYLYAIGGNAEAARRGGVSLGWNRLWAFTLTGMHCRRGRDRLSHLAWDRSPTTSTAGTLCSTPWLPRSSAGPACSADEGRWSTPCSAGLVIATIYNGMGLLGLAASYQYMVTALVLLGRGDHRRVSQARTHCRLNNLSLRGAELSSGRVTEPDPYRSSGGSGCDRSAVSRVGRRKSR